MFLVLIYVTWPFIYRYLYWLIYYIYAEDKIAELEQNIYQALLFIR